MELSLSTSLWHPSLHYTIYIPPPTPPRGGVEISLLHFSIHQYTTIYNIHTPTLQAPTECVELSLPHLWDISPFLPPLHPQGEWKHLYFTLTSIITPTPPTGGVGDHDHRGGVAGLYHTFDFFTYIYDLTVSRGKRSSKSTFDAFSALVFPFLPCWPVLADLGIVFVSKKKMGKPQGRSRIALKGPKAPHPSPKIPSPLPLCQLTGLPRLVDFHTSNRPSWRAAKAGSPARTEAKGPRWQDLQYSKRNFPEVEGKN